jgi:phosphinothricin acetyltransferase
MTPSPVAIRIRNCDADLHHQAIQTILNHVIATSTALYDYKPRDAAQVRAWITEKSNRGLPLRGAFDTDDQLLGFATYGPFRPQPAYKYTVELSIYVADAAQGQGVASLLMQDLIDMAQTNGYHVMIGCIDATNAASIALHQKFGFTHSGTIKQAGFKFGQWLDAAFYQKTLPTPERPIDG